MALFKLEIKHSDPPCPCCVCFLVLFLHVIPMFWQWEDKNKGHRRSVDDVKSRQLKGSVRNIQACLRCKNTLYCQVIGN